MKHNVLTCGLPIKKNIYNQIMKDEDFLIGFEFEFMVKFTNTNVLKKNDRLRFKKLVDLDYYTDELELYFTDALSHEHTDMISKYYRSVILYRRKPCNGWYLKRGEKFYNFTEMVQKKIDTCNLKDRKEIIKLDKFLQKVYVVDTSLHGLKAYEEWNRMAVVVTDHISKRLGIDISCIAYREDDKKLIEEFDVKEADDIGKKVTGWFMKSEYLDEDSIMQFGLELVTPPMKSKEAFDFLDEMANLFHSDNGNYKFYTTKTCGFHVNISHKNLKWEDIDIIKYSILSDENSVAKVFGRENNNMCEPYDIEGLNKCVQELKNTVSITKKLLNLSCPNTFSSASFEKMKDYGYIEYRLCGNAEYEKHPQTKNFIVKMMYVTRCLFDNDQRAISKYKKRFDKIFPGVVLEEETDDDDFLLDYLTAGKRQEVYQSGDIIDEGSS